MTPVTVTNTNTNKDILHDEENKGQEAALSSSPMPMENEMAANHPEEAEEPDADETTERPSHRTNRYRFSFSRSQALAALVAGLALVGTVSVVSRAARASSKSKTSISSNLQASVVLDEVSGYEVLPGYCLDEDNYDYPYVAFFRIAPTPATAQACADKCDCVKNNLPTTLPTTTFRGFSFYATNNDCYCWVDSPVQSSVLNPFFTAPCFASDASRFGDGAGPIMTSDGDPDWSCYKVGGGNSKASKTPKAAKRG